MIAIAVICFIAGAFVGSLATLIYIGYRLLGPSRLWKRLR
jgi:uncharacterized membrane protein YoaK (UPF0700 family)